MDADISELVGKVFTKVVSYSDAIEFYDFDDEVAYELKHYQDCCEHVYIESIEGDVSGLAGHPITIAEENSNSDQGPLDDCDDSYTWTFYKLANKNGYVDIRFYGTSNGYYSESVDLVKHKEYKGDPKIKYVTITEEEYISLKEDQVFLSMLHAYGVDNWDGYDDALMACGGEKD
jgi:hypothetical protein